MSYHLWIKLAAAASMLTIAACSGGDDDDNAPPGPVAIQDQFGSTFSTAFKGNNDVDPIDPKPGDLPAVSLTTDPINF